MTEDNRIWMYHQLKCPKGKIFTFSEVPELKRKGWVDRPAKIGKGFRGKWYKLIIFSHTKLKPFWLANWKWIITTIITTILAVIALYLELKVPKQLN